MSKIEEEESWDGLSQGLVTGERLDEVLRLQQEHPGTALRDAIYQTDGGKGLLIGDAGEFYSGTTVVEGAETNEADEAVREWNMENLRCYEPDTRFRRRAGTLTRFGKYYLGRVIGAGGSGRVYSAFQQDLGREVALKFPSSDDAASLREFFSESHLMAKLNHPNIVRIFEVGLHEDIHFLSMEAIRGKSLDRCDLNPVLAVRALRDAAYAVEHTHRAGILHQDLKPQNIMLDREGRVALIDFGLAIEMEKNGTTSSPGVVRGTPSYMSPEQVRGERVGPWSDVYALGATLYRSVAKRVPFRGNSLKEVLSKVESEEAAPLRSLSPDLPEALETIVSRAMSKNPAKRHPSAKSFASDLERMLKQAG